MKSYTLLGPGGPYTSDVPGTLGGSGAAKIYGRLDCPSAVRAVKSGDTYQKHRVFFENEAVALASGYRPCGNCMREQYKAWKADPQGFFGLARS